MDRVLSGATIPGKSGPGSNRNEWELHIPQSPSITGTSDGAVVIVVGNEHDDTSSNPGRDWLHFT